MYSIKADETVVGRDQLLYYIRREHEAEGVASVSMGTPVVEGEHVVGEFWTTMSKPGEIATLIGCSSQSSTRPRAAAITSGSIGTW